LAGGCAGNGTVAALVGASAADPAGQFAPHARLPSPSCHLPRLALSPLPDHQHRCRFRQKQQRGRAYAHTPT
jgi:hypothetical protein